MDLIFAVLRHAEYRQPADVPSAWLPWPLTERGIDQAKTAAAVLREFAMANNLRCIPGIDTSHMLRAWQTATVVAAQLEADLRQVFEVREVSELAERGVGAAANLTIREIERILDEDPRYDVPPASWKSKADYRLPFQGAESLVDAGRRVAGYLENAWNDCRVSDTAGLKIIVGHGASIRHAACELGMLTKDRVGAVSMFHAAPIFMSRESGAWQIVAGNWKPRGEGSGDEFSRG